MKRLLSIGMLLILLMSCFTMVLPVGASETEAVVDWNRIYYQLIPETEGGETPKVRLTTGADIPGACTLDFDATKTSLKVNGQQVEPGFEMRSAGEYELLLTNLANQTQQLVYTVKLLPNVNVTDGQVFTEYPVITCDNARSMAYQENLDVAQPIQSGEQIRKLGRFILTVNGHDKTGRNNYAFVYVIYVKAVHAVEIFDAEHGHALDVIVGTFDDHTVAATLDETRTLNPGSNIVTEVGTHRLDVRLDGAACTYLNVIPDNEALSLRIAIQDLDSLAQKTPYDFDFTGWNATVLLDGKPVSGKVRVAKNGKHTLKALDKDGNQIENAFVITTADQPTPVKMTTVNFRFKNPNFIVAIVSGALALGVFAFATYLFVARRRLV
ncbi:MAG: hypothetical protein E7585_06245 [Ruminococcaceae bacterium]|nr:hypothetical protein [Oscillospiraceae bacterium]